MLEASVCEIAERRNCGAGKEPVGPHALNTLQTAVGTLMLAPAPIEKALKMAFIKKTLTLPLLGDFK
jgi:hypothetical protein